MTLVLSSHLYIQDESNPQLNNLPSWANYLIDLGQSLKGQEISDHQLIWVLIVPDTRYVSSLLAFGYLSNEFKSIGFNNKFEILRQLPPGTPVKYTDDEEEREGVIYALTNKQEKENIWKNKIHIDFGNNKKSITESISHRLTILPPYYVARQSRSALKLGGPKNNGEDSLKCVFNGEIKQIKKELSEYIWFAKTENEPHRVMNLQDIVRAQGISIKDSIIEQDLKYFDELEGDMPWQKKEYYFSRIDQINRKSKLFSNEENPDWIFFTNSRAFIKNWNDPNYKDRNWVIVVSPKEPRYSDVKHNIEEFMNRNPVTNLTAEKPPMGIEVLQMHLKLQHEL